MTVPHAQLSATKVNEHENTDRFYTGQAPGPTVPKKDMLQPGWGSLSLPTFLSSEFHSCSGKDPWLFVTLLDSTPFPLPLQSSPDSGGPIAPTQVLLLGLLMFMEDANSWGNPLKTAPTNC